MQTRKPTGKPHWPLGLLGVHYCSPGVDAAVSRLLDEVAA